MTLKDELAAALANLATAESARDGFKTQLETEVAAHGATRTNLATAETERDDYKTKHGEEVRAHASTKSQLSTVTGERDTLKAKDSTASSKSKESLAARGVPPVVKDTPGNLEANEGDPAALWEAYAGASSTQQAEMRAKHGDKLDAAAYDAAQARR
jgi:hypothetical protein